MGKEEKLEQNTSSKTMESSYSALEPMEICKQIALKSGIAVEKITNSNYHSFDIVKVRNVFVYLCRMYTSLSYIQTGNLIGCKDYAILIREHKKVVQQLQSDPMLRFLVEEICIELRIASSEFSIDKRMCDK